VRFAGSFPTGGGLTVAEGGRRERVRFAAVELIEVGTSDCSASTVSQKGSPKGGFRRCQERETLAD
jgi:hypothetical protein